MPRRNRNAGPRQQARQRQGEWPQLLPSDRRASISLDHARAGETTGQDRDDPARPARDADEARQAASTKCCDSLEQESRPPVNASQAQRRAPARTARVHAPSRDLEHDVVVVAGALRRVRRSRLEESPAE